MPSQRIFNEPKLLKLNSGRSTTKMRESQRIFNEPKLLKLELDSVTVRRS